MGRMLEHLTRLRSLALRHAARDCPLSRVSIHVAAATSQPNPVMYTPMLCVVLQGAKQVMIGDRVLRYDPASYFVGSLELPVSGCVIEASPAEPYIAVAMALDLECLTELLAEMPDQPVADTAGFAVSAVTAPLLDAWARLIGLLDTPHDIPVLAPMLEREILYRLLQGPQGGIIRQAARADSRLGQIRQAIGWLRRHYDRPVRIETLAEVAGMSMASFHRHFRAATAMSPLQFQKSLRLQEARRLLIANADASRAGYAVGYESASQFSREYARMFGAPPARDAERLREAEHQVDLAAVA
jgi:AraC-like DNA-binding protein